MTRRTAHDLIQQLRALAGDTSAQQALAIQIVADGKGGLAIDEALAVLAQDAAPAARQALLGFYDRLDKDGARRDPLGSQRVAVLKALRLILKRDDVTLLERGVTTYERSLYDRQEICCVLRASALVALEDIDPKLASYHAVRLLFDDHTDQMSGEPALTAVQVLATASEELPLYGYALSPNRHVEVAAECLRNLHHLPDGLLPQLAKWCGEAEPALQAGLYDLLLVHPAHAVTAPLLSSFLVETLDKELFRYVVASAVSHWSALVEQVIGEVLKAQPTEDKQLVVRDALRVRGGLPSVDALLARLDLQVL